MTLLGTRVRGLWPATSSDPEYITDASGIITHVSWREDGTPGLLVKWDADFINGELRIRDDPTSTHVPDPAWLVTVDGQPLDVPPRTVRTVVAGGVL